MEWEIIFNSEGNYVEFRARGELTREMMNKMAAEFMAEMKKRGIYKCLLNYSGITKVIGTLDIYDRPNQTAKLGLTPRYRLGVLMPREFYESYKFAENVYKNKGIDLEIFNDMESVIKYMIK